MVPVVQSDREAAADAVKSYRETRDYNWQQRIRQGACDDGAMIQAFARYRATIAAEADAAAIERGAGIAYNYAEHADRVVARSVVGACRTSVMGEAIAGRAIAAAIRASQPAAKGEG